MFSEIDRGTSDGAASRLASWWPDLDDPPGALWIASRRSADRRSGYHVMLDYQRSCLVRRVVAARQPLEVMTEFWENLLNVPTLGDPSFVQRVDYGRTMRRNAFSSYEQILTDAVLHPAMLLYLDQATSTKEHPNENLGREVLELHTVGRGAYDERAVRDSARILTGWRVETAFRSSDHASWARYYDPETHWTGPVQVMGFAEANADPGDADLVKRYLRYLAHHERTALRIARRLAVKFVRDDPSPALVEHLASVYLDQDTEIVPVLEALVDSREFRRSERAKVRDPGEDLVNTYRVLKIRLTRPTSSADAAQVMVFQAAQMGSTPFTWPRPDGAPIDNASWTTPARMLGSFQTHHALSGGRYPKRGLSYARPASWLPRRLPVRFDRLVDELSRSLLHRPASRRLVRACGAATGHRRREVLRNRRALVRQLPALIAAVLDSPEHFYR